MTSGTLISNIFDLVVSHVKGHMTSYLMDDQVDDWWYTDLDQVLTVLLITNILTLKS